MQDGPRDTGREMRDADPASGQDTTAELVRRAQAGELAAFNQLVVQYQDAAYSLALRFLGDREAAEDATQEAFIRAYRGIARFQGDRFRSWLLTIVANAARDELRRRKRRVTRSIDQSRDDPERPAIDPADDDPGPEALAEQLELRGVLERALASLPEDARMAVLLVDVHGMSYEEVANAVAIPVGTVRSRLSRARARLREVLRTEPSVTAVRQTGDA